jgi:hypothetical protein
MKLKQMMLRLSMVGIAFFGIAALNQSVHAAGCIIGGGCFTSTGSFGHCGGVHNCQCFGLDGSITGEAIDCSTQ